MKVFVQCQAAIDLTPEQIRSMVDPGISIPSGGILKAWIAGHEGVARPMVEVSKGEWQAQPISWGKAAVQQITKAIKIAAAKMRSFWDGHPDGEEKPDRKTFGRIVGGGEIEKNGKLYSVVVGHFPDAEKAIAEQSDVISMEAFWNVVKSAGQEIATGVDEIFGFALARSSEAAPGFPGAHEIRAIQAYQRRVYAFTEAPPQEKKLDFSSIDPKEIPIDLIKRALVAKSIRVHDLYEPEDVFGEAKKLADGSTTFLGGSKKFQAYLVDEVAKGRAELQNKIKELEPFQQKAAQLEGQVRKFGVIGKVEKAIQDSKLPETAQKYLKSLSDTFDPGENPDEAIKQFIETGKAKYEGIFGSIVKEKTQPATTKIPNPATDSAPTDDKEVSVFGVKINKEGLLV